MGTVNKITLDSTPRCVDIIQTTVCAHFGMNKNLLFLKSKKRNLSEKRHIVAYMLNRHTSYPSPHIGFFMGGLNHSSALHGIGVVNNLIDTDGQFKSTIDILDIIIKQKLKEVQQYSTNRIDSRHKQHILRRTLRGKQRLAL